MDRRTKYTKRIIKETFLSLLSKKDIKKITVSELCKKADINRATFYRYYLDIYDLLNNIQNDFIEELKAAYTPKNDSEKTVLNFTISLLNILIQNKELIKCLFNTNNNIYFLHDILEIAYVKCKEQWKKDLPDISEEDIEYATIFIFNGALGVVNYWVQNNFDKRIEEVAAIIEKLSYYGTQKYIYKK